MEQEFQFNDGGRSEAGRLGNKRCWVEGRFYCDKEFDRKFEIIS